MTDSDLQRHFDVCIVGGGIVGVSLFAELARRGYRTLLVERGDLASGTSQASGMLAWGGLLYLRNREFRTVAKLSAARDRWLDERPDEVCVAPLRYLPLRRGGRSAWWVRAGLELYWWLGRGRRRRPFRDRARPDARWPFLRSARFARGLGYEEARMTSSDARLVLGRALESVDADRTLLDRTELLAAESGRSGWDLDLRCGDASLCARASVLVNAAGVWTDRVGERIGVRTKHTHLLSKGVYLVLRRPPELDAFLAFESGNDGDVLTLTPWANTALWGSTETFVETPEEGFAPTPDDVAFLARRAAENLARPLAFDDVVGLRTGVRPLAVRRGTTCDGSPLDLTRGHAVEVDTAARAVTLFGGKFTSAESFAGTAADAVAGLARGTAEPLRRRSAPRAPVHFRFADHQAPLIDPAFARDHERCRTLVDYLRRRTDLAQQIPRLGLGRGDANVDDVLSIARSIEGSERAPAAVDALRAAADHQDDVVRRGLMQA